MDHLSSLFSRKCVILTHKCESVIVTQPLVTVVSCWRKSISVVGLKVDQNNASNNVPTLADSGFFKNFLYQGGVKSTVSWVLEDLKFKISEGYDPNWCFPDSAQLAVSAKLRQLTGQSQENTNLGPNLLKF